MISTTRLNFSRALMAGPPEYDDWFALAGTRALFLLANSGRQGDPPLVDGTRDVAREKRK